MLAMEATEVSMSRVEHRLVPVAPAEPLAGTPDRSPIPLADHVAGAANAVRDRACAARACRARGLCRHDRPGARRHASPAVRLQAPEGCRPTTARRSAEPSIAVAALIIVVAVLGLGIWYLGPFRGETPVDHTSEGQAALTAAADNANQVFGSADLLHTDPTTAATLLQDAWDDLQRAKEGVDQQAWQRVHDQVAGGLDELYATYEVSGTQLYSPPSGALISGLVSGPDEAAYAIVGPSVVRIDPDSGASTPIVTSGEGSGQGIGQPRLLARGGPDLLILDTAGSLWRWRPSDASGAGTLGQVRVAGDQTWGADVVDFETFVINPDQGLYRIYVPYPASSQILRYEPTADGSGFSAPAPYFVGESEDVAAFSQLLIDGDVYAVTAPDVLRYFNGRALDLVARRRARRRQPAPRPSIPVDRGERHARHRPALRLGQAVVAHPRLRQERAELCRAIPCRSGPARLLRDQRDVPHRPRAGPATHARLGTAGGHLRGRADRAGRALCITFAVNPGVDRAECITDRRAFGPARLRPASGLAAGLGTPTPEQGSPGPTQRPRRTPQPGTADGDSVSPVHSLSRG